MSNARAEQWKKSVSQRKIKHWNHLKHIVKQYDKPEHILNIIVQGSDNKILLIKIVFNEGKHGADGGGSSCSSSSSSSSSSSVNVPHVICVTCFAIIFTFYFISFLLCWFCLLLGRLSLHLPHLCTLLKLLDGMRCHVAGTLMWFQVTPC